MLALALAVLMSACGEFVRDNPFDPKVPVTVKIVGPDTVFFQNDTVHFAVTTDPAYPLETAVWTSTAYLPRVGDSTSGNFRTLPSGQMGYQPQVATISVRVGARVASKTVAIFYRPSSIKASASCNAAPIVDSLTFIAIGDVAGLCAVTYDARGFLIRPDGFDDANPTTVTSLDPGIVRAASSPVRLTSVAPGRAHLVVTKYGLTDTFLAGVQPKATFVTVVPSSCATPGIQMRVGDVLQLSVTEPVLDKNRVPIADPQERAIALATFVWYKATGYGLEPGTVTPSGQVVARSPGYMVLGGYIPNRPGDTPFCQINVM